MRRWAAAAGCRRKACERRSQPHPELPLNGYLYEAPPTHPPGRHRIGPPGQGRYAVTASATSPPCSGSSKSHSDLEGAVGDNGSVRCSRATVRRGGFRKAGLTRRSARAGSRLACERRSQPQPELPLIGCLWSEAEPTHPPAGIGSARPGGCSRAVNARKTSQALTHHHLIGEHLARAGAREPLASLAGTRASPAASAQMLCAQTHRPKCFVHKRFVT